MVILLIYNYGILQDNKDIRQLYIVFLNYLKLPVLYLILMIKNRFLM